MLELQLQHLKMETKKTNKELLVKGVKTMGGSLLLMFLGPILFYIAATNKEKPLYIPLLIISFIICIGAIILAFKGLKIILEGIFHKN